MHHEPPVKRIIAKYQFQPWSLCKRALPEMPFIVYLAGRPVVLSGLYGQGDQKDAGLKMFLIKRAGRQRGMNRVEAEILLRQSRMSCIRPGGGEIE
jgi:hypothetical protein